LVVAARTILRVSLALALAAIACGGCDDADSVVPPAIHDLGEPWQAAPFAIDPAIVAAAEQTCRDPRMGMMPQAGMPLVLADVRGGNYLYLKFAAGGNEAECFVQRDANGILTSQGGGSSSGGNAQPALAPTEIQLGGSGSQSSGNAPGQTTSFASGRAGGAVMAVEIVLSNGRSIQASLNGGWFAAWWPSGDSARRARGYDASGTLVGTWP
jgi:hypothetical protein